MADEWRTYPELIRASRPTGYWRLDERPGATVAVDEVGRSSGAYIGGQGLTVPYADFVRADRPTFYYRLNDPGASFADQMGGPSGVLSGAGAISYQQPSLLPNGEGASTTFAGTRSVTISGLDPIGSSEWSMETWFRFDGWNGQYATFGSGIPDPFVTATFRPLQVVMQNALPVQAPDESTAFYVGGAVTPAPSPVFRRGEVYHLVVTVAVNPATGSRPFRIYVNGEYVGGHPLAAIPPPDTYTTFTIGAGRQAAAATVAMPLVGAQQEFALYDYPLTDNQVWTHYRAAQPVADYRNLILQGRPIAYWRLGEEPGATVARAEIGLDAEYLGNQSPNLCPYTDADPAGLTGWTSEGATDALSLDTTRRWTAKPTPNTQSWRTVSTGTGTQRVRMDPSNMANLAPVVAGRAYSAALYMRADGPYAGTTHLGLTWYDASGAAISTVMSPSQVMLDAAQWLAPTIDGAVAPSGATYAGIVVEREAGAAAQGVNADAAMIVERATVPLVLSSPEWTRTQSLTLGVATPVAGMDTALRFGGVPDFMLPYVGAVRARDASLSLGPAFTFECWLRAPISPGQTRQRMPIFDWGWSPDIQDGDREVFGYLLYAEPTTHRLAFMAYRTPTAGDFMTVYADIQLSDGNWHHLAVTADPSTGRVLVYGDGLMRGISPAGTVVQAPLPPAPFWLGGRDSTSPGFRGEIDEVAVYDRALGIGEVRDHARQHIPPPPPKPLLTLGVEGAKKGSTAVEFNRGSVALSRTPATDFAGDFSVECWFRCGAAATYADVVLADNPAGYWRLADTGSVAVDETGGSDGTISSQTPALIYRQQPSLLPNGEGASIRAATGNTGGSGLTVRVPTVGRLAALGGAYGEVTFECWYRFDPSGPFVTPSGTALLNEVKPAPFDWRWAFGTNGVMGLTRSGITVPSLGAPHPSGPIISDGNPHHLVAVAGVDMPFVIYVDGFRWDTSNQQNPNVPAVWPDTHPAAEWSVGGAVPGPEGNLVGPRGWFQEFAIYDSVLNDLQVAAHQIAARRSGFMAYRLGANGGWSLSGPDVASGAVTFTVRDGAGQDWPVTSSPGLDDGVWHHCVVTFDGTTLRLYLDGELSASAPSNPVGSAADARPGLAEPTYAGALDEVAIYDSVLSPDDILARYEWIPPPVRVPDLAGLSLGGAYQAGLLAGITHFKIIAYRQTPMADPNYLWREVAPAVGYVAQTTSPGSGGVETERTPPEGSFFTLREIPGVADQTPDPGSVVPPSYRDIVLADDPILYYRMGDGVNRIPSALLGGHRGTVRRGADYSSFTLPRAPSLLPNGDGASSYFDGDTFLVGADVVGITINDPQYGALVPLAEEPMTLEAWIRFDELLPPGSFAFTGLFGPHGQRYLTILGIRHSDRRLVAMGDYSGQVRFTSTVSLDFGETYHVVLTSASRMITSIYVNGQDVTGARTAASYPQGTNRTWLYAGGLSSMDQSSGRFTGWMQEVAAYDYMLDAQQVAAHYDAATVRAGLSFAFEIADDRQPPADATEFGIDPATGRVAWWVWEFDVPDLPQSLLEEMRRYNGPPRAPVDVDAHEFPEPAVDPLGIFSAPPVPEPLDLIEDVPQFERQSYEIQAVLRVAGNELARIEAGRLAMIQNFYPATADVLLDSFERLLGLPPNPAGQSLTVRRARVLAYMRRLKGEGRGLDWEAAISELAGSNWSYQEHDPDDSASPQAYTVAVQIPETLARVGWDLVRDVTPAHIAVNESYSGGWLVGIALIGITDL